MKQKKDGQKPANDKHNFWNAGYSTVPPKELVFNEPFIAADELSRVLGSVRLDTIGGAP